MSHCFAAILAAVIHPDTVQPMTKLTPIESEFASTEEAEAHDAWVRAKVERALASKKPRVPHSEVMAKAQAILDKHR